MTFDVAEYKPLIDAILSAGDPDRIKPRNIRNALQELYDVDLEPHKQEIADFIVERFHGLKEEQGAALLREQELKDRITALELQLGEKRPSRGAKPKPKRRKTAEAGASGAASASGKGFHVQLLLSPELQAVIGQERMSRPQVSKHLWAYIKGHGLQQESNKKNIECDAKLRAVFHTDVVDMFKMTKMLSNHLYREDEVVGDARAAVKREPPALKRDPGEQSESEELKSESEEE